MNKAQKELLSVKSEWLNFFNNDRFGKHRKLFDWVTHCSNQIITPQIPKENLSVFNPGKKIAIVSLYTPEISDFAIYSEIDIKEYCEKQGYTFYIYRNLNNFDFSPNWAKPNLILNHIKNHEHIIWMDSDLVIFNKLKKFEDIINRCPKHTQFIACKDIGDHCMLNSGVLIFKNHTYAIEKVRKWAAFDGDKSSIYSSGGDQEIFCEILRKTDPQGNNRKILPMSEFNTDPRLITENTFILHFMAYPHELKKIFMSYWNSNQK